MTKLWPSIGDNGNPLSLGSQPGVADAVEWYESKEVGLSLSFLDELDRVVRLIRRHPHAGSQVDHEIRRFLLPRFPYSLVYGIEEETIVVIAVAHQHRRPEYWADRVEDMR